MGAYDYVGGAHPRTFEDFVSVATVNGERAPSPLATNGFFASTDGHVLVGQ